MADTYTHPNYVPNYTVQTGNVSHLPHIMNTKAGIDRQDPMHSAIFEVYFQLPLALKSIFGSEDEQKKKDQEKLKETEASASFLFREVYIFLYERLNNSLSKRRTNK